MGTVAQILFLAILSMGTVTLILSLSILSVGAGAPFSFPMKILSYRFSTQILSLAILSRVLVPLLIADFVPVYPVCRSCCPFSFSMKIFTAFQRRLCP